MMDLSNLASQSTSQTTNASNTPLPGAIMPALPLSGAVAPAFNHAIALQQYQFQQSLMNQQIVAQQQAVAHAVSIKAAAARAAARAVEISMLLNGETNVVQRSEDLVAESEREKSGLEARSRSTSPPQSSKPNTIAPINYRNSLREPEEHSPRDRSGYESRRNSSSYSRSNDLRGYSRSSYRRGEDYSSSRSSYDRSRNTSWSRRRRSPLSRSRYRHGDSRSPRRHVGSRSPRRRASSRSPRRRASSRSPRRRVGSRSPQRHVGSRSPRCHRIRSPSPISRQRTSSRASNRHKISKSPAKGGSSSTSPPRARKVSPRKATARRSLSSSEDSPIHNTENLLLKENKDAKSPRGNSVSGRSNSDHFGEMNSQEPALKKSVSRSPRGHVGSRSPRHHRNRSPSPQSRQRTSSRISSRHSISKITLKAGSSSSPPHSWKESPIHNSTSPPRARKVSPRKATARRRLSSSEDSPIHNTENLLLKENKDAKSPRGNSVSGRSNSDHFGEMNSQEPALKKSVSRSPRGHVGSRSPRHHRNRSSSPQSRQRTSSRISSRHSISKITLKAGSSSSPPHSWKESPRKPAVMKSVSRDFASASMDRSDSDNSEGQSVRRGLGSRDCKYDSETTVPPRSTDQINLPTEMLDRCSNRNDRDTKNGNGNFSMSNGKKLHESATEKGIEVGHRKPSRISKPLSSLEPEGNLSDHGQRNYSDKCEEKMHVNKEFDMQEQEVSRKVISSNEEDSANISGECAIYPLPEGHGNMNVKEVDFDGDAKADGHVSASPKVSKHREKRHKQRSTSRDRRTKHHKSHHKKHRDESGEEEEGEIADKKRERHEKRKMKRREKKGRDRYH